MGVEVHELTKIYDGRIHALVDVSLRADVGVLGLLGPNGSGKTTLMSIMATLLEPTRGTLTVDGYDVRRHKPEIRRRIGYLPQDVGLYPTLTVEETLDYLALLYEMTDPKQRRAAIEEAMERLNLTSFRDRQIQTLSGGMRQRVALAQALLARPHVLIVDEPTAGLDPEERIRVRSFFAELARECLIVLSTHIVADVEAIASTLVVLRHGRVRYSGTPEALLRRLDGKVWTAPLAAVEARAHRDSLLETGLFRDERGIQVRAVADDRPVPDAEATTPTLEDAYVWLMATADRTGAEATA